MRQARSFVAVLGLEPEDPPLLEILVYGCNGQQRRRAAELLCQAITERARSVAA
jgi:hypothetical protein